MQPTNSIPTPPTSPTPPNSGPVMDVVAPPPAERPDPAETVHADAKHDSSKPKPRPDKQKPAKPTVPKEPSSGVGLAIFATVVIVLGLAALATYAYIKTR